MVVRDEEMVSVLSDQWKGLARAAVEEDDPVIPISQVDWTSMTSVVYDPLHAYPSIARRDRIRIFLSHLMSIDGRVLSPLLVSLPQLATSTNELQSLFQVCLSPIQQRIVQVSFIFTNA